MLNFTSKCVKFVHLIFQNIFFFFQLKYANVLKTRQKPCWAALPSGLLSQLPAEAFLSPRSGLRGETVAKANKVATQSPPNTARDSLH